jgi:TRAP-type C4-dicarboxylate transport system substrate-binding protein
VAIPFPELYSALEQGTVDAQENANGVTVFAKLTEVQKHFTETRHGAYVGVVLFSGPVWKRLNDDERRVLTQAGESSGQRWRKALADEDQALLKRIGEKLTVTTLTPAARAEMHRVAQPVIDKHMAAFDAKWAEQVKAALASVRAK